MGPLSYLITWMEKALAVAKLEPSKEIFPSLSRLAGNAMPL